MLQRERKGDFWNCMPGFSFGDAVEVLPNDSSKIALFTRCLNA